VETKKGLMMDSSVVTQSSNYFDLQGLDQLRQKAQGNDKGAIREVANQFESMFASMLIKSMRQANEAFETDSPFNNKNTKFYTDMQDKQLALDISRHGSLGLADALVRQLDPTAISGTQSVPQSQLQMPGSERAKMMTLNPALPTIDLNKPDKTPFVTVTKVAQEPVSNEVQPVISTHREEDVKAEKHKFTDKHSFIETLMPYAKKVAKSLGISPAVLIAQSALETGWGKKIINDSDDQSSFNLFNIKAHKSWQGDKVSKHSLEVEDGVGIKRRSDFRAYQNFEHSFADYGHFITTNKRYQEALQQGTDAGRYVEELQKAGYATDPQYADKIKQIMDNKSFKASVLEGDSNG